MPAKTRESTKNVGCSCQTCDAVISMYQVLPLESKVGLRESVVCILQESVELDPEYRKISRERNRIAATKTRTAQVIDARSVNARTAYTQTYANKRKACPCHALRGHPCILWDCSGVYPPCTWAQTLW